MTENVLAAAGFRCTKTACAGTNMFVCAATAFYAADYKITVSGSRPGGAPTSRPCCGLLSAPPCGAGEVGFFPSMLKQHQPQW